MSFALDVSRLNSLMMHKFSVAFFGVATLAHSKPGGRQVGLLGTQLATYAIECTTLSLDECTLAKANLATLAKRVLASVLWCVLHSPHSLNPLSECTLPGITLATFAQNPL